MADDVPRHVVGEAPEDRGVVAGPEAVHVAVHDALARRARAARGTPPRSRGAGPSPTARGAPARAGSSRSSEWCSPTMWPSAMRRRDVRGVLGEPEPASRALRVQLPGQRVAGLKCLWTSRYGASTSRISHVIGASPSSGAEKEKAPPTVRSTVIVAGNGSHQPASPSGVVIASQTLSTGWPSRRSKRIVPCAPSRSTVPWRRRGAVRGVLPGAVEVGFEAVEPVVPGPSVQLQPRVQLLQRLEPGAVAAALAVPAYVDQPCGAQHLQVPGDAGLVHADEVDQLTDRPLLFAHRVEDGQPGRFGDRLEGLGEAMRRTYA